MAFFLCYLIARRPWCSAVLSFQGAIMFGTFDFRGVGENSDMSSSPDPSDSRTEPPKSTGYKSPGLRGIRTTSLFRAVNPELFIKPMEEREDMCNGLSHANNSALSCRLGWTISHDRMLSMVPL
ncbi:small integral membrane protein 8 isoform X2 [Narcine bancroftii]|uniref:small integral membrane protein 8 isoform X2 n=1 Tax=Narcine bancroftii TaxID=1343680 RepID=UPI0038316745